MQISNTPLKWLYPWAQLSTTIFELPPTTTAGDGRACQSIGFPAETMLPPESGGVPPQGIDFNAGLYQVARITWWLMYGGGFVYDATFATNSAISGYAQGAEVSSTDYLGFWLNTADNNQINPDTVGTNWVPGYVYGRTTTALTNANVTLTPLQAAKKILVFTGTLTSNVVVTLPAWVYEWNVLNQCSGAFTLTLTTSGGSGAVVPQGGSTKLRGDGTNINYDAINAPTATASGNAMSAGQIQAQTVTAFLAGGSAPNYTLTVVPAIAAYAANQRFRVAFAATGNLGSNTLNVNGLGAKSLLQYDAVGNLVPVQVFNGLLSDVEYNGTAFVVLDPPPQSDAVGASMLNLVSSLGALGTSTNFTIDEIVAKTAPGGGSVVGASLTLSFNGATTGTNGMDTGTLPLSGWVAIYAIYNPTTATWATLGVNASTTVAPSFYAGGHMPTGYVYSCLMSVLLTTGTPNLQPYVQFNRSISIGNVAAASTSTPTGTMTSLSLTAIPPNARSCSGILTAQNTTGSTSVVFSVASAASQAGIITLQTFISGAAQVADVPFSGMQVPTPRTLYYAMSTTSGTATVSIIATGYTF